MAARSAVQGCLEYLDTAIFGPSPGGMATTTREVFVSLLRSFWEAHACILEVGGALSTLTAAVVLPLQSLRRSNKETGDDDDDDDDDVSFPIGTNKHIVCACNVGDSLGYVYSKRYGVREFTQGSHDIYSMRDMRDALGALGPVDGNKPELGNLTLSMTIVDAGDIVFLTSDGISDNFDPVVGKFAEPFTAAAAAAAAAAATAAIVESPVQRRRPDASVEPKLAPKRQNKSASAIVSSAVRSDSKLSHRFSLHTSSSATAIPSKHHSSSDRPPVRPSRTKHQQTAVNKQSKIVEPANKLMPPPTATMTTPSSSTSSTSRPKFLRSHTVIEPRVNTTAAKATPSIKTFPKSACGLPLVTGPQRHQLTLLRLEDLLCYGINGTQQPCPSARKLCHLLVDFARMITSARRNILEQRELFYRTSTDPATGQCREVELNKLQQRAARKRVVDGATFATLPGKLDHASVVAFTVASELRMRSVQVMSSSSVAGGHVTGVSTAAPPLSAARSKCIFAETDF